MNREIELVVDLKTSKTKASDRLYNKGINTIYDLIELAKDINENVLKYVLKYECKSLKDIIETNKANSDKNQEYFEVFTGVPFEVYDHIVKDNVICEERFNEIIDDFWYEYETSHQYGSYAVMCFFKRWNLYY